MPLGVIRASTNSDSYVDSVSAAFVRVLAFDRVAVARNAAAQHCEEVVGFPRIRGTPLRAALWSKRQSLAVVAPRQPLAAVKFAWKRAVGALRSIRRPHESHARSLGAISCTGIHQSNARKAESTGDGSISVRRDGFRAQARRSSRIPKSRPMNRSRDRTRGAGACEDFGAAFHGRHAHGSFASNGTRERVLSLGSIDRSRASRLNADGRQSRRSFVVVCTDIGTDSLMQERSSRDGPERCRKGGGGKSRKTGP